MIEHLVAVEREVLVEKIDNLADLLARSRNSEDYWCKKASSEMVDRNEIVATVAKLRTKLVTAIGVIENLLGATNLKNRKLAADAAKLFIVHHKPAK